MKVGFLSLLFSLISFLSVGNKVDSLENQLKTADDSLTVSLYYNLILANEYSNPKKAIYYSLLSLKHPLNQGKAEQAKTLINLGKLYKNISLYDSATKCMLDGIRIAEEIGNQRMMAMGYNSLGIIFKSNSEWDNALKYYKLSHKTCSLLEYPNGIAMTLNNIGTIYDAKNQLDSAIYYYKKASQIGEKYDLIGVQAISYNNIGEHYAKRNLETEALPYFFKSLKCDSITNNQMGSVYTLLNIANSYKVLQKYPEAFEFFEKSRVVATNLGSTHLLILYHHGISDTYEKVGNEKLALENFKKYQHLNDSVFNEEKSLQLVKMRTQYETEKKELEIENLSQKNNIQELEIEKTQTQLIWSVIGIFSLVLLGAMSFFQYKTQQKRKLSEALVEEQQKGLKAVIHATEEERKRIAKDLHDGVGQQLSGLRLFFSTIKNDLEKKEPELKEELNNFEEVLDNTCTEVRSISHQMMPKTLMEKGLIEAIEDMLTKSLGLSKIDYNFEHFGIKARFEERLEISIYRICQELISNVIKHSKAEHVSIQLIKNKKHLVLLVEDDGRGFVKNKSNDGIGKLNMSSRINTLNGSFSYDSEPGKGTVATIRIPL